MTHTANQGTVPAPFAEGAFPDIAPVTYGLALANVRRAAYTLFATPEHDKLHQVLETEALEGGARPIQVPLDMAAANTHDAVLRRANLVRPSPTDGPRLVQLGSVLIQFADYIPGLRDQVNVPYDNIAGLREAVTARVTEGGRPLGLAEQLGVALEFNDGNVIGSLWNLFTTSRLHARWLDGSIVNGAPDYTREERVRLMHQWREAVAAFKPYEPGKPQDPNGDTYYAWTHALAKVAYATTPERSSMLSRAAVSVFHRGTNIMHKVVHTFVKQGVDSNHDIAATYGNIVGQTVVDALHKNA